MKYQKVVKAKFIERENRFIATVLLDDGHATGDGTGRQVKVHVKNTGRCKELLVPGCTVYLEDFEGRMGTRKMQYSLVAVEKVRGACERDRGGAHNENDVQEGSPLLINMDSQAPNKVVHEALEQGRLVLPGFGVEDDPVTPYSLIRPETTHGDSRFDFYVEGAAKAFIEVKGVTLEEDGFARFPDAPTERGLKHINGLIDAAAEGYRAYIIFVIQMKTIHTFGPNYDTQPEFGEALKRAKAAGVEILAFDCIVEPEGLQLDRKVEIRLEQWD